MTTTLVAAPRIEWVAGAGAPDRAEASLATPTALHEPYGIAGDAQGNLFVIEMAASNRLLRLDATGKLAILVTGGARTSPASDLGDGGSIAAARFFGAHQLAVLPSGDVLVADTWHGCIRRLDWARDRVFSLSGYQVAAEKARANGPYCITLSPDGARLHVADLRQVHEIDLATGKSRLVAGNGRKGRPAEGAPAIEAPLVDPRAAAADAHGNVYILERGGHALRVVDRRGQIRTVVNGAGRKGAEGDGGEAWVATLNGPKHLCVDPRDQSVLIADAENHLIRRYDPVSGRLVRVAGTGRKGLGGVGGAPEQCELNRPHGVWVTATGTIYIADSYNHRILRLVSER